jgi:1,4-alpha-glucan branching enzyme
MREMSEIPKLVQDDPWLEQQSAVIQGRLDKFHNVLAEIRGNYGSLRAHAALHRTMGIHQHADGSWMVCEWLPKAKSVHLIGDFNGWDRESHPLAPAARGVWQLRLPKGGLDHTQRLKLRIIGADGSDRERIPACIRRAVQDPDTADFSGQIWEPSTAYEWLHEFDPAGISAPVIYEAHVGMSGEEARLHSYREFADQVLPRIVSAGYNIVQLMAVQEHPYYGSFGYHVSSFFAPSSRFGTPEDLKYLIDTAHSLGLAVLLDVVHSHAVKNYAEGLSNLDGSGNLYFHAGEHGDHPQWDSKCFDYSRHEVRQFLLSNVRYWLEEFRFDGFRFDGVTSMLYWNRGAASFTDYWQYFGDDADADAVLYLQLATTLAREIRPGAILIAEDMSGLPGLCRPVEEGGVGFSHRLAMGIPDYWIKLLKHTRDEDWDIGEVWGTLTNRRHGEANIAYAESHDQALVGDKTLAFWLMDQAMYWHMGRNDPDAVVDRGIALHKIIRLLTYSLGGEGWLNFMGNEFGHPEWLDFPREGNGWSYHYCRRQWSLRDDSGLKYQFLAEFDRALLACGREGQVLKSAKAELINIDTVNQVLIYQRAGLVFVCNLSPQNSVPDYEFWVPVPGKYRVILDTDSSDFGGHARIDPAQEYLTNEEQHLSVYTPSRTALVFCSVGL